MKIAYIEKQFSASTMAVVERSNAIIAEYQAAGYELTLRQLYYQHVARGHIANTEREYKRLGAIINDARLAGLVDWEAIVDRTRELRALSHWAAPEDMVQACAEQFRVDGWADQPEYVEVWIEKDALFGIVQQAANAVDVPYFSCRGYNSQSAMWAAGYKRIREQVRTRQRPVTVIHLGDHDPSGLDMTRDIEDRLSLLSGVSVNVERIALNIDQVRAFNPPPNPTKVTDSRARGYIARWGRESWELDALDPATLDALIQDAVRAHRDEDLWEETRKAQADGRARLAEIAKQMNNGHTAEELGA